MRFVDDEAVTLDCGCTAESGENYYEAHIKAYNFDTKQLEDFHFTYCGNDECFSSELMKIFDNHAHCCHSEYRVRSAYDKECEYGDCELRR